MPDPRALAGCALALALLLPGGARAQAGPGAAAGEHAQTGPGGADTLSVAAGWDLALRQPRDAAVALDLSRDLRPADGRLVVVVGRADLSPLLELSGRRARVPLRGLRLPSGDLEVVAYVLSPAGAWRELGRFPFRRLAPGGLDSAAVRPRLDVQESGQLAAALPPGGVPGARGGAFQDLTVNGGGEVALRRGSAGLTGQALMLGASHPAARLRATQLGARAPAVDLASYQLRLGAGPLALTAGPVLLGHDPHLSDQLPSRGVQADLKLSRAVEASASAAAGSELVGWSNPFGLARPSHRILLGTLAVDALPAHPGVLRLDLTALHGALEPISAFNQAAVTDREQSDGLGAQLGASDPSQRVRLALGLARSRFTNPADPALAQDATLVPVRPETRSARFGELTLDALRGARIGPTTASLTLSARRERIDPQYRSVAAATLQADRDQTTFAATGALDALQLQASATAGRDNLDHVATLLTTRSRGASLNASLPVAQLVRASPAAWWWPALSLAWQAVHQAGGPAPPDGGFRFPAQVPDQRTTNLALGSGWQRAAWSLNAHYARALVDNRQPGRESADLATDEAGATLGLTPSPRLNLALDASLQSQRNVELGQRTRNGRLSLQVGLRPLGQLSLDGTASLVTTDDALATRRGRDTDLRLELSQGFNLFVPTGGAPQGRVFLRFARSSSALRLSGTTGPDVRQWSLSSGLSLRLF